MTIHLVFERTATTCDLYIYSCFVYIWAGNSEGAPRLIQSFDNNQDLQKFSRSLNIFYTLSNKKKDIIVFYRFITMLSSVYIVHYPWMYLNVLGEEPICPWMVGTPIRYLRLVWANLNSRCLIVSNLVIFKAHMKV